MGAPGNVGSYLFSGYGSATDNIREDLWDAITLIAPAETPALAVLPRDRVRNVLVEWLTDTLSAAITGSASGINAAVEGDDFSLSVYGSTSARARVQNVTQIFRKDVAVTDTERSVNAAGVTDEYEYQVMKAGKELMKHIETRIFIYTGAGSATATSATARVFAGLSAYALPTTGANGAITTAAVNGLHKAVWTAGGNPDTLYCSPATKAVFSQVAQGSGTSRIHNIAAADKRLIAVVNVYDGDFGVLNVVPSRQIQSGSATASGFAAYMVEREKLRLGVLREMKHTPLYKGGDSTRGMVLTELTLKVMHASAHGAITGLSDT